MITISIPAGPRRRPDGGGYARGEETRARIIAAALEVFGQDGYARASTRQIADAAGVNPPALQYYFDSKDGLHRACAEFIVEQVRTMLAPSLAASEAALASGDRARMMDALCEMIVVLADFALSSEDKARWSRFMGRGEVDDAGPAFDRLRDGMVRPVHEAFAALVGPLTGQPADSVETHLRTIAVLSPLMSFHAKRASTLDLLGWSDFAGDRIAQVKAALLAHTRAALSETTERTAAPSRA